ncbi:DUF6265 family protein [uncultured Aquimarina sp.]|uniref:DUF6265 family protein n=1 Tax=uncultured Aquimarina sp. TaxID=575652 RepID=UPI00262BA2A2|nr:DUF6265 family protein [uncultured Aquimarina sp.]
MKKVNYTSIIFITLCFLNSCIGQTEIKELNFMVGVWKIENKTTYEEWKKEKGDQFIGVSYKLIERIKKVSEHLLIKKINDTIIYQATVPNQNDGKTINFTLNNSITDKLSFENLSHDFPRKIQYQKINDSKLFVQVLDEDDKGFSYYLIRQ